MRVLIIGSGGREHTLAWKLVQSPRVEKLYVAPGNGGTAEIAENVDTPVNNIAGLVKFARQANIDLTVVGPEAPLVAGLVDAFQVAGLRAFGPTAAAAQLEGSKAFAKTFMFEEGIPTAPAAIFDDYDAALAYLRRQEAPIVVKASGLAAGKGVLVCTSREEAEAALHQIMVDRAFGTAGDQVLIETCLEGEETSLLAFSDGQTVTPMLPARDYKRALDGDRGLNTGGMGGYAPSPHLPPAMVQEIFARVLRPAVDGMLQRGTPYKGVLYAGMMLTKQGPRVLEFNCRFGDPETQMLLPLLDSDLLAVLLACVEGRLAEVTIEWRHGYNVGVVLASGGYPGAYEKGKPVHGLENAAGLADVIFHAGTAKEGDQIVTSGGRVMAVNAVAPTLQEARARVYAAIKQIHFDGMQFRSDIAQVSEALMDDATTATAPTARAYVAAGVDIDAGEQAVQLMRAAVERTFTSAVLSGVGSFGGLFSLENLCSEQNLVLVASTDGVGTKTLIAQAMGRFSSIGYDIVNHCVNDILVQGARPLFFLDYIASAKLRPAEIAEVVTGCADACRSLGCALIGGETAEMPGVYLPDAFDLVGTMVGWVNRDAIVDGRAVRPGDICVGIPSSGPHTNGFSLVRRIFADTPWDAILPELERPLGDVLLAPHRAYLHEVETLWEAGVNIKAMAHITGGGFYENLPRVVPQNLGVRLDREAWEVPPIFRLIQTQGHVDEREMYRVFNMGIGLVLIVSPRDAQKVIETLSETIVIGETFVRDNDTRRVLM
jgi:phosphoribosylamine--glycine ligase/phosphoribosylformylglycinamidine cyclo-ligase